MHRRIALSVAGICILAAGCSSNSNQAPTSTTAAPVAEAALGGLLLSAAEVATAMGVTQMSVARDMTEMEDYSATVSRPECLPIFGAGAAKAYAGSGWTAFHAQDLKDPARTHIAAQSVVLFPSPEQAAAFFTASTQSWRACSNGSFTNTLTGGRELWDVGPISDANGILSTVTRTRLEVHDNPTTDQAGGETGQRVLTVRNNIVIDIATISSPAIDSVALNIAQRIAAKVPSA